jgi:hypothetical protein
VAARRHPDLQRHAALQRRDVSGGPRLESKRRAVRFVYVPRSHAGVVVTTHGPSCKDADGCAYAGYLGITSVVWIAPDLDRYSAAQVIAHELGHVLGLGHTTVPCAAMSAGWYCPDAPAGEWRCRLLERDDVEGAVHLYGGTVGPLGPVNCPIPPRR